jgi:4-amino-4-deoxy-L-arabinose transferase-like glycosyltransferase
VTAALKVPRRAALAAIVAASVLFHLKGFASPLLDYHYHRQTSTAAIARNYHRDGLHFMSPRIDWDGPNDGRTAAMEFPLYTWLIGALWPIAGLGVLWGRVLSLLFSVLTAVYLYFFVARDAGDEAALYAGLIFTALPVEIYFGRTVQPESLALLATMAALYHWDRSLERGRSWGHWLAAVVAAFLAVAHKLPYAYIFLPLAAQAYLKLGPRMLRDARVWIAPVAAALAVFAWYHRASTGVYVVPTNESEFASLLDYGRLGYFVKYQFLSRYPELTTSYAGLLFVVLGFRDLVWKRGRRLYAWWLLAVGVDIVAGGHYTFDHEYTSLPFAPVNAALAGAGLAWLRARAAEAPRPKRRWALAGVAVLALSIPVHAVFRISRWYKLNFPYLTDAAKAADAVSASGDLFVCNQRAASLCLYYLDRRGWSWDVEERGEDASRKLLDERIADGARFYFSGPEGAFADRRGAFAAEFIARHPLVYDANGMMIFRLR